MLDSFRDTYRALKGQVALEGPVGSLVGEGAVLEHMFDVSSKEKADDDVQELISSLFPDQDSSQVLPFVNRFQEISDNFGIDHIVEFDPSFANAPKVTKPGTNTVDPVNFKAQVFGRLLSRKFFEKLDDYSDFQSADAVEQREDMEDKLEALLSSHGFSSLQYAYTNQIFSKLKRSRLQERKFMKKLWDKILVNTLSDNRSGIHPECRDLYDQLNVQTNDEANSVETDFFRIDDVKQEILDYYKKSLCRDVYEKSGADENAVRISLTHGVIKLSLIHI